MSVSAFSVIVRARVMARSGGLCEHCNHRQGHEYHHRRNRGQGGSKDPRSGYASNCLLLCNSCHRWATDHKPEAMEVGVVVSNFCPEPASVPVWRRDVWVLLDDEGGIAPVEVTT